MEITIAYAHRSSEGRKILLTSGNCGNCDVLGACLLLDEGIGVPSFTVDLVLAPLLKILPRNKNDGKTRFPPTLPWSLIQDWSWMFRPRSMRERPAVEVGESGDGWVVLHTV